MAIGRTPLQHSLNRRSSQHALTSRLNMWPTLDIHAEESEHSGHGEGKIRQIGQGRPVQKGDIMLVRLRQSLFEDIPLSKTI